MLMLLVVVRISCENVDKIFLLKVKLKVEVVDYEVGELVQIIDGFFVGVLVQIMEINMNNQCIKVLVEIFGCFILVDFEFNQIEKI